MTSTSTTVFLGLGSNLGDRQKHFRQALTLLARDEGAPVEECSSFYETEPFGLPDQPRFLNAVISLKTSRAPLDFLEAIKKIERSCGRTREGMIRWGPREIDLDILLWEDMIIHSEYLHVPHPGMHERRFVLVPLNEIAPGWIHPELGLTVSDLLASCADTSRPVVVPPDPELWSTDEAPSPVKRFQNRHNSLRT